MISIEYKTKKLQRICNDLSYAEKAYGKNMAEIIHKRIDQISAAVNVEMLVKYGIGKCHPLKGNRKNQYAMVLIQPYRLVFEIKDGVLQIVKILEIVDYH